MNRILHIEDDVDDSDTIQRLLWVRFDEIELTLMSSGEMAIQFLEERIRLNLTLPGVIILDIHMPGMDGKSTFESFRSITRLCLIPVVILTSSIIPHDQQYFQSKTNVKYYAKPTQLTDYNLILDQVLNYCVE